MKKRMIRIGSTILIATMFVCTVALPIRSTMIAAEEHMAGGEIALEEYAAGVVSGEVTQIAVANAAEQPAAQPSQAPQTKESEEKEEKEDHVTLNLNYDRLGIANKVKTYLNVRKKPSESSKVVGKLTKNAGCHVYKIKKGWAKIVSGKVNGWVKASYMVFDEKAEKLATKVGRNVAVIDTPALKVRQLPTTKSHMYSVVAEEEEFEIRKERLTKAFVEKIIKKEKISSKRVKKAGGIDAVCANLQDWICIKVDNEYAFVAKEYTTQQYSLKRAVKIGDMTADASAGISSSQANVVEYAKQFLGNPYVWAGTSLTHGTDCSGFTLSVYAHFGYSLPHSAAAQCSMTRKVSDPKPGDLFFYSNGSRVNHVAMYIGSGMVIHASNPSDGIKISNAYYRSPVKIGRVMN